MIKPSTFFLFKGVNYSLESATDFSKFSAVINSFDFVSKCVAKRSWSTALTNLDKLKALYNKRSK